MSWGAWVRCFRWWWRGRGEECWRAIYSAWLVEGKPPLSFLPLVGCCGYVRARPHDSCYGGTMLPLRLTCGRWCPVGERWNGCWRWQVVRCMNRGRWCPIESGEGGWTLAAKCWLADDVLTLKWMIQYRSANTRFSYGGFEVFFEFEVVANLTSEIFSVAAPSQKLVMYIKIHIVILGVRSKKYCHRLWHAYLYPPLGNPVYFASFQTCASCRGIHVFRMMFNWFEDIARLRGRLVWIGISLW